jgi:pimeloyl-ACP methyl ester carboxylesterase
MNSVLQVGIFALSLLFQYAGPSVSLPQTLQTNTWKDKSPHRSQLVQVNGIRVHYLDWGGQGETLLFLAGLGNNGHIFDDLAPRFTNHFHVLAMTRRGFGQSDKPESGYDIESRVADDLALLDALQIKRVILAGHSIAGDELTAFAVAHPDRVDKLIYLDAAIDRSQESEAEEVKQGKEPAGGPSIQKEAFASVEAYLDHFRKAFSDVWSDAFEANLRDGIIIRADGTVERRAPDRVYRAIRKGSFLARLDYTKVKPPTLSFYSDPSSVNDPDARKELAEEVDRDIALIKRSGRQIQIAQIPGAGHYLFIDHREEVVTRMQRFLADAPSAW